LENRKQSDISIATPQHPLTARDVAATAAIVAIIVHRATAATLTLSVHFSTLSPSLAVQRVGKEDVRAGGSLLFRYWWFMARCKPLRHRDSEPRYRNTRHSRIQIVFHVVVTTITTWSLRRSRRGRRHDAYYWTMINCVI